MKRAPRTGCGNNEGPCADLAIRTLYEHQLRDYTQVTVHVGLDWQDWATFSNAAAEKLIHARTSASLLEATALSIYLHLQARRELFA